MNKYFSIPNKLIALFFCICFILYISCSDSDSSSDDDDDDLGDTTTVSGTLNSSIASSVNLADRNGRYKSIDEFDIVVFSGTGSLYENIGSAVTIQTVGILPDGSFSFTVDEGDVFVAFLVNPDETFVKTLGIIGIKIASLEYWESIDTSYIEGDIVLGNISIDSEMSEILVSENDLESLKNQISDSEEIKSLARLDDSIRFLKNYINTHEVLDRVDSNYVFYYSNSSIFVNSWADSGIYSFSGYRMHVHNDFLITDTAELYPPDNVEWGNGSVFTPSVPCIGNNYEGHFEFGWGETDENMFQSSPEGYWRLYVNGVELARPDFCCFKPVNENDKMLIPHPVLRINTESGQNEVESIEIRWYRLNADGTDYIEILQEDILKYVSSIDLEISDFTLDYRKNYDCYDEIPNDQIIPDDWHIVRDSPSDNLIQLFSLDYRYNGMKVKFMVR